MTNNARQNPITGTVSLLSFEAILSEQIILTIVLESHELLAPAEQISYSTADCCKSYDFGHALSPLQIWQK